VLTPLRRSGGRGSADRSETQDALERGILTNAFLAILTLVGIDTGLSLLERRSQTVNKLVNGVPLVIVEDGKPLQSHMNKARISADDVLEMAREQQGVERLEQIKYAVLERSGGISVIPR
jgi:uncharacterized membrane protein YcaP (DUF421 family)